MPPRAASSDLDLRVGACKRRSVPRIRIWAASSQRNKEILKTNVASNTSAVTSRRQLADDTFVGLPLFAFTYPGTAHVDLYSRSSDHEEMKLVCDRRRGLAENELDQLTERGFNSLFVRRTDYQQVAAALYNCFDLIATDDKYPIGPRLVLVQAAACDPIESAAKLIGCEQFVEVAQRVGGCIGCLMNDYANTPLQLFNALKHDDSYAVHATNCAMYVTLLAKLMGEAERDALREIAIGAMLHDIGLRRRKNSRGKPVDWYNVDESDDELSHSQLGYEQLCGRDDVTRNQALMVYQHHEHVDGSGEPVGLVGDEIHPWARMLAVVNQFASLTCDRPKRRRQPIANALALMTDDANTRLEAGIVTCWTNAFQNQ